MSTPYDRALSAIDAAHALDPTKHDVSGTPVPYELHYAQKCTAYLSQRAPDAPETLRLAIRAQHFRRWEVPRSSYPATRAGYLTWRAFLKRRQADLVKQICLDAGYNAEDSERVGALIRKEGLKSDEEAQVLEDVACLVFLEEQLEGFEEEHGEDKVVGILRRTWAKMSDKGKELAEKIELGERGKKVLERALKEA